MENLENNNEKVKKVSPGKGLALIGFILAAVSVFLKATMFFTDLFTKLEEDALRGQGYIVVENEFGKAIMKIMDTAHTVCGIAGMALAIIALIVFFVKQSNNEKKGKMPLIFSIIAVVLGSISLLLKL